MKLQELHRIHGVCKRSLLRQRARKVTAEQHVTVQGDQGKQVHEVLCSHEGAEVFGKLRPGSLGQAVVEVHYLIQMSQTMRGAF